MKILQVTKSWINKEKQHYWFECLSKQITVDVTMEETRGQEMSGILSGWFILSNKFSLIIRSVKMMVSLNIEKHS